VNIPRTMSGVALMGHGGPEMLEWNDNLPVPEIGAGEVLLKVLAAGLNNTDINTRTGWYSKSVTGATTDDNITSDASDGTWDGNALTFPHIQGADCCGEVVAVGDSVDPARIGERVIVRTMQNWVDTDGKSKVITLGSERQGAFAQFMAARSIDAVAVNSTWTDIELASIPCATTTAEGMLQRANLGAENVLITGASGGVGSAAIQLAKRRGATVWAITKADKAAELRKIGADHTLDRDEALPENHFDVVIDLVAGPRFDDLLCALKPKGRYVASGAIVGPLVTLDVRTLYRKDLSLLGSTAQPDNIIHDVIGYIERGEIKPLVSITYPMRRSGEAQAAFAGKAYIGKIVLTLDPFATNRP
jgi:NADPH:quinone reductase-like Zn-dependent oxidoreductase